MLGPPRQQQDDRERHRGTPQRACGMAELGTLGRRAAGGGAHGQAGPSPAADAVLWLRPRCRAVWEFYKKLNVSLKYVPLVPPAGTDALGHTETCVRPFTPLECGPP